MLAFSLKGSAQQAKSMNILQDSLIKLSNTIRATQKDEDKLALNGKFVKELVELLKTPNSFAFTFDSLKNVSVIPSPDKTFKIFSWYVELENGTYRYYGAIQMNTNGSALKLYPLIDQTENITDANVLTNNQKWFGARYYEIISVSAAKMPYYVLLGWKGNTQTTTKKVIDILNFGKDNLTFGAPVFDGKELQGKNRIIYEYNKSNAMTLKSDLKAGMIVLDHIAPFDAEMVGRFEYYGSDGTFDGFRIIGGRLKFQENIELKNDPNGNDDLYADPTKNVKPIRKF